MAAPFLTLPPEVLVMIMSFSESLGDLWSLIQASPAVLSCFSANRQRFLQPHIRSLNDSFGGDVPLSALLSVYLRYIRNRWPSGGSIENLQYHIKSVLQTLVPLGDVKARWLTRVPILSALLELVLEADWIISDYSSQAWEKMQDKFEHQHRQGYPGPFLRKPLKLCVTERRLFQDALFRYENYCQAFFHNRDFLFEGDETLRSFLMFQSPCLDIYFERNMAERFYSIVHYIYDQHCSIVRNVVNSLETHNYIHYLTSQGFGMLLALQRMNIHTQRDFTSATFFQVSQSGNPVVLLVDHVDGHRTGIIGGDRWMPCVHSWYNLPGMWQYAAHFWLPKRLGYQPGVDTLI
ncbi:hypothetical protein BKA56DRAFT_514037 [Ilyonectria sp. MPI-CAGE-AT-0026]|nr:hypothetical protein BKA56DRAFT_514037 [Ilyonectria sp. MPI-CAGE-AT-0026]